MPFGQRNQAREPLAIQPLHESHKPVGPRNDQQIQEGVPIQVDEGYLAGPLDLGNESPLLCQILPKENTG